MHNTGERFFEQTKYPYLSEPDQEKGLPMPKMELPQPDAELIHLPAPASLRVNTHSVFDAINKRKSYRKYSDKPLSLEDLTWLLWATQGVKEQMPMTTKRTVPSAGSRHPFETYLVVNNVTGLKPGLYRYMALSHQLALIREQRNISEELVPHCLNQKWIAEAAVTFIWVAVPYRTTWRYSERGWRYLFAEAGHVCQSLYMACSTINAGCCAVDAFYDNPLNDFLGIDGKDNFAIYLAPVGLV